MSIVLFLVEMRHTANHEAMEGTLSFVYYFVNLVLVLRTFLEAVQKYGIARR